MDLISQKASLIKKIQRLGIIFTSCSLDKGLTFGILKFKTYII